MSIDASSKARRTSLRKPLHADVEVVTQGHSQGVVLNISADGIRITCADELAIHSVHTLAIQPVSSPTILRRARVVWNQVRTDGCVAGLEYLPE